jgi:hypothetical protein
MIASLQKRIAHLSTLKEPNRREAYMDAVRQYQSLRHLLENDSTFVEILESMKVTLNQIYIM